MKLTPDGKKSDGVTLLDRKRGMHIFYQSKELKLKKKYQKGLIKKH